MDFRRTKPEKVHEKYFNKKACIFIQSSLLEKDFLTGMVIRFKLIIHGYHC